MDSLFCDEKKRLSHEQELARNFYLSMLCFIGMSCQLTADRVPWVSKSKEMNVILHSEKEGRKEFCCISTESICHVACFQRDKEEYQILSWYKCFVYTCCVFLCQLEVQSDINEKGQKRGCKIPNHHFQESYSTVSIILVCCKHYSLYICVSLWVCLHRYIMYTIRTRQIHVDALSKLINWHSFKFLQTNMLSIFILFSVHIEKGWLFAAEKGGGPFIGGHDHSLPVLFCF